MSTEAGGDFERRFGGIRRLYGEAAFARFRGAHVCVIGIGGVGSWAAEALARSAIGRITLVDLDNVCVSNVNRQVHALDHEFGKAKVAAMAGRIRAINPECAVTEIEDFVGEENLDEILGRGYDYVIDAIDGVKAKAALIAWCKPRRIGLVTVGGAGGQTDPTRVQVADLSRAIQDPLAAKVRSLLRRQYSFPRDPKRKFGVDCVFSTEPLIYPTGEEGAACFEKDMRLTGLACAGFGSSMCVTAAFGLAAASRVLQRLAGK
ncbi:MAG: tRNA cyclic N6-threonylcarbamoyladenosine(37) synthase TcdA [Pseudomonadota bacterium]